MRDLLVATNNPGKLNEFRRLLGNLPARVLGPADAGLKLHVPEPHATYAQNAAAKARAFWAASGVLTVADDSGIEVAALGWGPGPRSNRYGGTRVADRAAYLLQRLGSASDRRARMVCWLAVAAGPGEPDLYHALATGHIAPAPRGSGGFGYDPIFIPDGARRTFGEMDDGSKDAVSHRGRAVAAALPRLRELVREP